MLMLLAAGVAAPKTVHSVIFSIINIQILRRGLFMLPRAFSLCYSVNSVQHESNTKSKVKANITTRHVKYSYMQTNCKLK